MPKNIDVKNFITERILKRKDISSELDIEKTVSEVINFDEEFINLMEDAYGYSGDDEINYIIGKTGYEFEFVELLLWQKCCYEMMQGFWEYDAENCINCNSSKLLFKEVENIDFADKIVCQACGFEMTIGDDGLEPYEDWLQYLDNKISFPFEAIVCEYQEGEAISEGDKLIVHNIEGEEDLYGVIVSVRKGRKKYSFSLIDLEPISLNEEGKKAISKYKEWFSTLNSRINHKLLNHSGKIFYKTRK